MASVTGPVGARRLEVTGKANKTRSIPIDAALEQVLAAYQASRAARFADHDLDHPATPLLGLASAAWPRLPGLGCLASADRPVPSGWMRTAGIDLLLRLVARDAKIV